MVSGNDPVIPGFQTVGVIDKSHRMVWRALDQNGRAVAIKLLDRAKEPVLPKRLDRNRRALQRLTEQDSGLVPLLGRGVSPQGHDYVVSPYYPIGSLSDQLEHGPTPWHMAARLMAKVADTVGKAHDEGLVFGGLTPSSVLLEEVGQPVVAGFGMATRHFDDGRPTFEAPEANPGAKHAKPRLTPASDVYSLALILGALVAGKAKQRDETAESFLARLRELAPSRILDVIEHGIADSPTNRYRDASTMKRAIDTAVDADPEATQNGYPVQDGSEVDAFDFDEVFGPPAAVADTLLPPGLEDISFGPEEETLALADRADPMLPAGLGDLKIASTRGGDPPAATTIDPAFDLDLTDLLPSDDLTLTGFETNGSNHDGETDGISDDLTLTGFETGGRNGSVRNPNGAYHDGEDQDATLLGFENELADADEVDLTDLQITGEIELADLQTDDEIDLTDLQTDLETEPTDQQTDDEFDLTDLQAIDQDDADISPDAQIGYAPHDGDPQADGAPVQQDQQLDVLVSMDQLELSDLDANGAAAPVDGPDLEQEILDLTALHEVAAGDDLTNLYHEDATSIFGDEPLVDTPHGPTDEEEEEERVPVGAGALGAGAAGMPFIAGDPVPVEDIPFRGVSSAAGAASFTPTWLNKTRVALEVAWFKSRKGFASAAAVMGLLAIVGLVVYVAAQEIRTSSVTETEGVLHTPSTVADPEYVPTDGPFLIEVPVTNSTTTTTARPRPVATRPPVVANGPTEEVVPPGPAQDEDEPDDPDGDEEQPSPQPPEEETPPPAPPVTEEPAPPRPRPTQPPPTEEPEPPTTEEPAPPRPRPRPTQPPPPEETEPPPGTEEPTPPTTEEPEPPRPTRPTQPPPTEEPPPTEVVPPITTEPPENPEPPIDEDRFVGAVKAIQASTPTVSLKISRLHSRQATLTLSSDQCVAVRLVLTGSDGSTFQESSQGYDPAVQCDDRWRLDYRGANALSPETSYVLRVSTKGLESGLTATSELSFTTKR